MAVNKNSVVNIAGYKFEPLVDPIDLVSLYQRKCDELKLKGTMLVSKKKMIQMMMVKKDAEIFLITVVLQENL